LHEAVALAVIEAPLARAVKPLLVQAPEVTVVVPKEVEPLNTSIEVLFASELVPDIEVAPVHIDDTTGVAETDGAVQVTVIVTLPALFAAFLTPIIAFKSQFTLVYPEQVSELVPDKKGRQVYKLVVGQVEPLLTYKSKSIEVIVILTLMFVAPLGTIVFKFLQLAPPQVEKITNPLPLPLAKFAVSV
jgi:hypothetical protein